MITMFVHFRSYDRNMSIEFQLFAFASRIITLYISYIYKSENDSLISLAYIAIRANQINSNMYVIVFAIVFLGKI